MSWVSGTKLQQFATSIRNKFVSNEIVVANSDKSKGAHLNVGGQDGLIIMSPMNEDGVTPAALWVADSEANNATELTGGTLSYVTDVGKSTEDYTSVSLVGNVVNVSGKSGAARRITNVADPVNDNDVVNKKFLNDSLGMKYIWENITPSSLTFGTSSVFDEPTYKLPLSSDLEIDLTDKFLPQLFFLNFVANVKSGGNVLGMRILVRGFDNETRLFTRGFESRNGNFHSAAIMIDNSENTLTKLVVLGANSYLYIKDAKGEVDFENFQIQIISGSHHRVE